jgi:hypothetical protein
MFHTYYIIQHTHQEIYMADRRQRKLESTMEALQLRYGPRALQPATLLGAQQHPPALSTGFTALDAITGCNGLPLGHITLISGKSTSGKATLSYKCLMQAQQHKTSLQAVALLDTGHFANPDYLSRAGIDLDQLLLIRPNSGREAVDILLDLCASGATRLIVLDNLVDLAKSTGGISYLNRNLSKLSHSLRQHTGSLLILDENNHVWIRWLHLDTAAALRQHTPLHIEIRRESWLQRNQIIYGYQALARVIRSRWVPGTPTATIAIEFNGTIRARATW